MKPHRDPAPPRRITPTSETPELLYDAECPWCSRWAEHWRRSKRRGVVLKPLQEASATYPEMAHEFSKAVHFIEPDGRVSRGVEALLRAHRAAGGARWPLWLYERCALSRWVMETIYGLVAKHRPHRRN